jgi:transcriptional regulator with XRE-family HTH domain
MPVSNTKLARVKKGLTQTQAAKALGISQGFLSLIENQQKYADRSILIKMMTLYEVKYEDII